MIAMNYRSTLLRTKGDSDTMLWGERLWNGITPHQETELC